MGRRANDGRLRLLLPIILGVTIVCGALGDPFLADEVPFEVVERTHFDAVGVVLERSDPDVGSLLELRVNVVGDASDASIDEAVDWLREQAGVHVVRDPKGAPLFLTRGDLAATSGRGTLGATVPEGMAVEMDDERISPCVLVHEVLHFVGLKHVSDRHNIMYSHCSKDFLREATIEPWQVERVATLDAIRATTPSGVQTWAERA